MLSKTAVKDLHISWFRCHTFCYKHNIEPMIVKKFCLIYCILVYYVLFYSQSEEEVLGEFG